MVIKIGCHYWQRNKQYIVKVLELRPNGNYYCSDNFARYKDGKLFHKEESDRDLTEEVFVKEKNVEPPSPLDSGFEAFMNGKTTFLAWLNEPQ